MKNTIIDINKIAFSEVFEIEVKAEPNQDWDCYIGENHFYFTLRTNVSGKSFLEIRLNEKVLCRGADVNLQATNLLYLSDFDEGAFFFWHNKDAKIQEYNFSNFGENLKLYYGEF